MNNIDIKTLDNGLQIILNQDKTKYRTTARIFVKAGGLDVKSKEKEFPYGIAHFLEHYLIEHSIYGNISEILSNEYISSNGITSYHNTEYYISTVHDFEENFLKLINVVNNPVFEQENIEMTKKPIIQEIKRAKDKVGREFLHTVYKNTFKNKIFDTTLGEIDTIESIDVNILQQYHKTFYNPSNQIIVITGNFDDDIIDIIEKEYQMFNNSSVERLIIDEPNEVINKVEKITDTTKPIDFFEITYKVNIKELIPNEKNKLDYYLSYILNSNFGERSDLFNFLIENKLTIYSIEANYDPSILKDFVIISITVYTSKQDEVIEMILDKFNNLCINEEDLNNWKNRQIIKNICSSENKEWVSNNLTGNILLYDLYCYDDIDLIKSLNVEECKNLMDRLEYKYYTITINDLK